MASTLTQIVKGMGQELYTVFASPTSIIEKNLLLRRLARNIATQYFEKMHYSGIEEFYVSYDKGKTPIQALEGEGVRVNDIIILNKCPMSPLFADYQEDGQFPGYWNAIADEYISHFKNGAILHPLCIVHQNFRDELAGKIPKGKSFVHSIPVACRSGSGKVVYSEFGLSIAERTKEDIERLIKGRACAFHVR